MEGRNFSVVAPCYTSTMIVKKSLGYEIWYKELTDLP